MTAEHLSRCVLRTKTQLRGHLLAVFIAVDIVHRVIGSDAAPIAGWQMVCRGVLVFAFGLLLVRVAGRRVFGRYTSFDIVLGVVLGSTLSRTITANAPFLPTLATVTILVLMHWLLAAMAKRSEKFARLVKGVELLLIENGKIRPRASMRRTLPSATSWSRCAPVAARATRAT